MKNNKSLKNIITHLQSITTHLLTLILVSLIIIISALEFIPSTRNFLDKHGGSVSALATLITAVITSAYVVLTQKQVKISKENIEQTKITIERMEDNLMPIIDVTIRPNIESKNISSTLMYDAIDITLTNVGTGIAILKEITTRRDLSSTGRLSYGTAGEKKHHNIKGITGIIIPVKESETYEKIAFLTEVKDAMKITLNKSIPLVSSVSIWYEDIYGRLYRTRIIYNYTSNTDIINIIKTEFIRLDKPYKPLNTKFDISENGCVVPYNSSYYGFLGITDIKQLKGEYPVTEITKKKKLNLQNISFWQNEHPTIECQVDYFKPFILIKNSENNSVSAYDLMTVHDSISTNGFIIPERLSCEINPKNYNAYGLVYYDKNDLNKLYDNLIETLKRRANEHA